MGIKTTILFLLSWFISFNLYSQEENSFKNEKDSFKLPHTIEHYFSASLTLEELISLQERVYEQVDILSKSERTREEDLALLQNAQLLGFLYPSIDDERVQDAILEVLLSVRNEFLSYSAKNSKDYVIKTELVFLMHAGALAYQKDDNYQFTRIISRLASEVYNKTPNAKVALALGQWYIGSNMTNSPLINNTLAEKYLNETLELDEESGYVSYLAFIYLSNLYFKTRNGDKARHYMKKAQKFYPDGSFAYIVDEVYFADGQVLF